jgi:hypothetical protein
MIETVITYLIVATATVWVVWSVVLPTQWRQAVGRTLRINRKKAAGDCGNSNCNCE